MRIHSMLIALSVSVFSGACVSTDSDEPTDVETSSESSDLDAVPFCPPETHDSQSYNESCTISGVAGHRKCTDKWTLHWAIQLQPPPGGVRCVQTGITFDSHTCGACTPGLL